MCTVRLLGDVRSHFSVDSPANSEITGASVSKSENLESCEEDNAAMAGLEILNVFRWMATLPATITSKNMASLEKEMERKSSNRSMF